MEDITNDEDVCGDCGTLTRQNCKGVYDSETLAWLGRLSHYIFEDDDAEYFHFDIAENNHNKSKQYLERRKIAKPFKYELALMNEYFHYKTLNSYESGDIIMHCYGILAKKNRNEVFQKKFTDEGPMVMADLRHLGVNGDFVLVLDGRDMANNWEHVTESCFPNCVFIDDFLFKKQDDLYPTYTCFLRAVKKIEVGETLRVEHKHKRGFKLDDTTCDCVSENTLYDENATPICKDVFCLDFGVKFGNVWQLYLHHLNYHSDKEMIKKLQKEMAYIKSFGYSCPVVSCMKCFWNVEEWRNHVTDSHPKFEGLLPTCSTCGKQFVGKRSLRKHVKKDYAMREIEDFIFNAFTFIPIMFLFQFNS